MHLDARCLSICMCPCSLHRLDTEEEGKDSVLERSATKLFDDYVDLDYFSDAQVCRMLASVVDVSEAIKQGVAQSLSPDKISANVYKTLWNRRNRKQRDFQVISSDANIKTDEELPCIFGHFDGVDIWRRFLDGSKCLESSGIFLSFLSIEAARLGRLVIITRSLISSLPISNIPGRIPRWLSWTSK